MRYLDMQNWSRRDHFEFFKDFNHPHFSICANVDVTTFFPTVKQRDYSYTVAVAYLIARTSNAVPEFRYRIRGEKVVEHDVVHPSFTILVDEDLFGFCYLDYMEDFGEFAGQAKEQIDYARAHLNLTNYPDRDDRLYMSPIPWVSFTSFNHPMQLHPADSVPRFAWGKVFEEGERLKMPLQVQGHHALMDGIHMGRFYEKAQDLLNHPEMMLGDI